jgi:hypothetical protein
MCASLSLSAVALLIHAGICGGSRVVELAAGQCILGAKRRRPVLQEVFAAEAGAFRKMRMKTHLNARRAKSFEFSRFCELRCGSARTAFSNRDGTGLLRDKSVQRQLVTKIGAVWHAA